MERPTTPAAAPTPEPPSDDATRGPETLDLVSIGLAVFFVALILVVGALLILPTIL